MKTGTVKFFNESKGYGFIKDEETGKEYFVHASGLGGQKVRQDDRVQFEVEQGKKGENAVRVSRI